MPICGSTWGLVKNADSGLFLKLTESESPGWRFRNRHKLLPGSMLGNYWITWNMLVWDWSALLFSVFNDTACIVDALLTYTCWSSFSLCISAPLHSDPQSRDLAHFRRLVIQELWGYSWDTAGHKAIKVDKASEENVLVHSEHSFLEISRLVFVFRALTCAPVVKSPLISGLQRVSPQLPLQGAFQLSAWCW